MPIAGSVLSWLGKSHPLRIAHVRSLNEFAASWVPCGAHRGLHGARVDGAGRRRRPLGRGGGEEGHIYSPVIITASAPSKTRLSGVRRACPSGRPPSDTQQRLAALSPWESPINKFCNGTIISHSLLAFNLKTFTSLSYITAIPGCGGRIARTTSRNSEGLFESRCLSQCLALVTTLSSAWIGHRRDRRRGYCLRVPGVP